MAKVGIVMGSDSDMPIMAKAADILDKFGIDYEMTIISAHREPDIFFEWAKSAEEKGYQGDHCRCRKGSTSAGNVRSTVPDAGCRYSYENLRPGRCGLSVFDRTDAVRNSGCDGSDQRRSQRRHSGSQDPGNF